MNKSTKIEMGTIAGDYPPPRHNVLLLSCMDVRLIDELASFMTRDNLTNRYDHLILAGAALGALQTTYPAWRNTFFEHLEIALELHKPEDVYIIEHRNCGGYRKFLGLDFGDSPQEQERERDAHREKAFELSDEIAAWCAGRTTSDGSPVQLKVHCFLMGLRGEVELLQRPGPASRARKPSAGRRNPKVK